MGKARDAEKDAVGYCCAQVPAGQQHQVIFQALSWNGPMVKKSSFYIKVESKVVNSWVTGWYY